MKEFIDRKILSQKLAAKERIEKGFELAFEKGYTCSLGFKINCNRIDKDNMDGLARYMKKNNIPQTMFRIYDNSFVVLTAEELLMLVDELIGYGLYLYEHKWEKEYAIATTTNYNSIEW